MQMLTFLQGQNKQGLFFYTIHYNALHLHIEGIDYNKSLQRILSFEKTKHNFPTCQKIEELNKHKVLIDLRNVWKLIKVWKCF